MMRFTFIIRRLRRLQACPCASTTIPARRIFQFKPRAVAQIGRSAPDRGGENALASRKGMLAGALSRLRTALPDDFRIGYSGDWGCGAALQAGADAWFSVVGGTLPVPAMRLTRAAMAGDTPQMHQIDAAFAPLWDLFKEYGSLRVVYALAHRMGLTEALPPRPILPVPDMAKDRIAAALDHLNALD